MMLTIEREDNVEIYIVFNEKYVDMFNTFAEIFKIQGLGYTFFVDDFEVRMRCREVVSDDGETERKWKSTSPVDFIFRDGEFAIQKSSDDLKWRAT